MKYKLGIFSTIRGGTTYMCDTLRHCNVDVGHTRLRYEGAVLHNWTHRVNETQFEHAWHQTRDPIKAIASIGACAQAFWREWHERIPAIDGRADPKVPQLRNAMLYWLWWTEGCEQRTHWRYRIEDVSAKSEVWGEICARLGLGDVIFPDLPTDTNTKPHPPCTWDELHTIDPTLANAVMSKATQYGYHV